MLVLTRGRDESILIYAGEKEIEVEIVDIIRGKIRLGIRADKDVKVLRPELIERDRMTGVKR